jgi:8-oxo-dGTP pyrophosphatase MutT (NUDIX family)
MIIGLGGKAGPGETDAACAVREAGEKVGITADPGGLAWRAELLAAVYSLSSHPSLLKQGHLFRDAPAISPKMS